MINQISHISLSKSARIAGILYLIIIISGIFAEFFVRSSLIIAGDAAATAQNIINSESLFRIGIAGDMIMILSDVALALFFYILLKPVSRSLSLLAAFFRLAQATTLGINLLNLFFVLQLLSGADYLTVFSNEQLHALVLMFIDAHQTGYAVGLVFFALSLLFLGYLIYKSGYFPKILGILLFIASIGYLIDSGANILFSNYDKYQDIFAIVVFAPAFIAELSLCLWLILKGITDEKNVKGV